VYVVEVLEHVARQLRQPPSGRVRGDAEDVYPAAGVLDDEERVELAQRDRVEVKQVAGQDRPGLRLKELRPGRTGPARRGIGPCRVDDLPHGGAADLEAESGEFAVDAAIPRVGFSVARRTVRARTTAGIAGRPGRVYGWSNGGRRVAGASAGSWLV
jgi:hypothetical protein